MLSNSSNRVIFPTAVFAFVLIALAAGLSWADVASWEEPALDRWFHLGQAGAAGQKPDFSTFTNLNQVLVTTHRALEPRCWDSIPQTKSRS